MIEMRKIILLLILCGLTIQVSPQIKGQFIQLSMNEIFENGIPTEGRIVHVNFDKVNISPPFIVKLSIWREKDLLNPKHGHMNIEKIDWSALTPIELCQYKDTKELVGYDEDKTKYEERPYITYVLNNKRNFDITLPYYAFSDKVIEGIKDDIPVTFFIKVVICKGNEYNEVLTEGNTLYTTRSFREKIYEGPQVLDEEDFSDLLNDDEDKEDKIECYPITRIAQELLWSKYSKDIHHSYEGNLLKYGIGEIGMGQVGIYTTGGFKNFKDGCYLWASVHRGLNNIVSDVTFDHMTERVQHHLCNLQGDLSLYEYRKVKTVGNTMYYKTPIINNMYQIAILEYDQYKNLIRATYGIREKQADKEIRMHGPSHRHHYIRKIIFDDPISVDIAVPAKYPETIEINHNNITLEFKKALSDVSDQVYLCQEVPLNFKDQEEQRLFLEEVNDSLDMDGKQLSLRFPKKKEVYMNTKGLVTEKESEEESDSIYFCTASPILALNNNEPIEGETIIHKFYKMDSQRISKCEECGDMIVTKRQYRFFTLKTCNWFKEMNERFNEF